MSHPNVACGPVPFDCHPRDLPALVADLTCAIARAEEHLEPTLRELEPIEPTHGGQPLGTGCRQTVFSDLLDAVGRAHRVAKLAELIAARVGYCPPKSGETCCDAPLAKGFR